MNRATNSMEDKQLCRPSHDKNKLIIMLVNLPDPQLLRVQPEKPTVQALILRQSHGTTLVPCADEPTYSLSRGGTW
jgi:hypothetical protein